MTPSISFNTKIQELSAVLENLPIEIQVTSFKNLNDSSFVFKSQNVFFGTPSELIPALAQNLITPAQIESILIDDLDHSLSLGCFGNLERIFGFLTNKDPEFLKW